jgi:hypothetical protein
MDDPTALPAGPPIPADDGAPAHLAGRVVPRIALLTTVGTTMVLGDVGPNARRVVYAYPRTGRPGEPPLSEDWGSDPGFLWLHARGVRVPRPPRGPGSCRRGRPTRCSDASRDHEGCPVPPIADNAHG